MRTKLIALFIVATLVLAACSPKEVASGKVISKFHEYGHYFVSVSAGKGKLDTVNVPANVWEGIRVGKIYSFWEEQ